MRFSKRPDTEHPDFSGGWNMGMDSVTLMELPPASSPLLLIGYVMGCVLNRPREIGNTDLPAHVTYAGARTYAVGASFLGVLHLVMEDYGRFLSPHEIEERFKEGFLGAAELDGYSEFPLEEHIRREQKMPRSEKPIVIEHIYQSLLDPGTGELTRTMVTKQDVVESIHWCIEHEGIKLSTENPANFIKDVIRGRRASAMWPSVLKQKRITARQVTGGGNVFEFVPYAAGQTEPFPDRFGYHVSQPAQAHRIQSVSMPLASKELGRDDETYLIQVAVKLAVVETHFALFSPINVIELSHLQIGIKLRLCELDSLFAAYYIDEHGQRQRMIITAEAKKKNQRILEDQIIQQVRAAFEETDVDLVVPIAMTASGGGIHIVEFKAVRRADRAAFDALEQETEQLYHFVPPVKGI